MNLEDEQAKLKRLRKNEEEESRAQKEAIHKSKLPLILVLSIGTPLLVVAIVLALTLSNEDSPPAKDSKQRSETTEKRSPSLSRKQHTIETAHRLTIGKPSAPAHIVHFTDFGCSHCSDLAETLRTLQQSRNDEVKITLLHFPLANCHETRGSCYLPRAAECFHEQGLYPSFDPHVFELGKLGIEEQKAAIPLRIQKLDGHVTNFQRCMEAPKTMERILRDRSHGLDLGVIGTPTTFLNGRRISGSIRLQDLEDIVDDL